MQQPGVLFVNAHLSPAAAAAGAAAPHWLWARPDADAVSGAGAPPAVDAPVVDVAGRLIVPAFADAHIHWSWLATALLGPDLSDCRSRPDVLERIAAWRGPGRGAAGAWIVGTGFDESTWADSTLPTRDDLDRIEPHRPVLLQRVCGHVGILNRAALAHVPHGVHTDAVIGRMAEDDLYAVYDLVRPDAAGLAAVVPDVVRQLHSHGITTVHDVSAPEMLQAFALAAGQRTLDVRVTSSIPARALRFDAAPAAPEQGAAAFLAAHGHPTLSTGGADHAFELLGVKLFIDGSLGARTACLRHPYADAAGTRGTALYGMEELRAITRAVDAAGLQLMVHAIGDAALDQALDALEPLVRGGNPLKHRLEHVEVTPPDLVARLAQSGLWVCAQPNFAGRWSQPGGMNEQRLGDRLAQCNLYRTLHAAGIPMAFGSDCMPLGPLFGLQSALRHPLASERLDAATALHLYSGAARTIATRGAALTQTTGDWVVLEGGLEAVAATYRGARRVFARTL